MAARGDCADLIQKAGAGVVCEPDNAEQLARAAASLASMTEETRRGLGLSGSVFYSKNLSVEVGVSTFEQELLLIKG
jgi:glycosyltransferase involved in cell wall biosynthesis